MKYFNYFLNYFSKQPATSDNSGFIQLQNIC